MTKTASHPYPEIAALLGGRGLLGVEPDTRLGFADRISKGLPAGSVLRLKEALGVTEAELARLLGVSPRTLARLRLGVVKSVASGGAIRGSHALAQQLLDPALSDRAYRLAYLLTQARQLLGEDGAVQWLKSPQRGIAGRVPLDLATTEAGAREVEALLHRIAHGVYA